MSPRMPKPVLVKDALELAQGDEQALRMLTNRDGLTFDKWASQATPMRREYEGEIRQGYPANPQLAGARSADWEGQVGYAREQAAVADAFLKRALAVARELATQRGMGSAGGPFAEARCWQQREEAGRWEALADTLQDWIWQARKQPIEGSVPRRGGIFGGPHD